jgi:putative redox protein
MELVLMALGSCSSLDLISILKKQRQVIKDISISIDAERADAVPAVFTKIHMTVNISGTIDAEKAEKAAELAIKKYCSVHDMLAAGGVQITYSLNLTSL